MKIVWILLGMIIAVAIFIFFPGLFDNLVKGVQWLIHEIQSLVQSNNVTKNIKGFI